MVERETVLFIGKFNPFHEGHLAIVDTMIEEGKNVIVMPKRRLNYFNWFTLKDFLWKRYKEKVSLNWAGSFQDVVHGRDTNYKFVRVKLPKELEKVSSTKIREGVI